MTVDLYVSLQLRGRTDHIRMCDVPTDAVMQVGSSFDDLKETCREWPLAVRKRQPQFLAATRHRWGEDAQPVLPRAF